MPVGRKTKSAKSPENPPFSPSRSPEAVVREVDTADDTDGKIQRFVRVTLTEIRRGQEDLHRQIGSLESGLNASNEFEVRHTTKLEIKIKDLMEKVVILVDQAKKQLSDHAEKLNKLERFSRRNNVRIIGLPQEKGEDCLTTAKALREAELSIPDVLLERAHRDGPINPGRPQHLLIKFNCYQDKIKVPRQQRQVLADEPYFCTDDLTKLDLQEKRRWSAQVSKAYQ